MYSVLKKYAPDGMKEFFLVVEKGTTAKKVPELLDIPNALKYKMIINGRFCYPETVLQARDKITLFPLIDGG